MTKTESLKTLQQIPGIGKSIAEDLYNIGIRQVADLKGRDPEELFNQSNAFAGSVQDLCLLYTFRCAVYFSETPKELQDPEKLKWWNWEV